MRFNLIYVVIYLILSILYLIPIVINLKLSIFQKRHVVMQPITSFKVLKPCFMLKRHLRIIKRPIVLKKTPSGIKKTPSGKKKTTIALFKRSLPILKTYFVINQKGIALIKRTIGNQFSRLNKRFQLVKS